METNEVTHAIIRAALRVHTALGPGLLESAYQACLVHELRNMSLVVVSQQHLPLVYDTVTIDVGYKLDLIVENSVIVEIKTVEKILPIHRAQLLSYLRLTGKRVGLIINFHVVRLADGIARLIDGYGP
jgi:GxxExxY protein